MAYRKSYPLSREWANALNLINVVSYDAPRVVAHWNELYALFHNHSVSPEQRIHKHLELLAEMAQSLGFPQLKQTDIDKYYIPEVHGLEVDLNTACQQEWYRVLKNTNHILVESVSRPTEISNASIPKSTLASLPAEPPKTP
jgi:alcohol dehydrogenase class IV